MHGKFKQSKNKKKCRIKEYYKLAGHLKFHAYKLKKGTAD